MLILILIDAQYLHNIVFSFKKGSHFQNHSSSGSHHLIKSHPAAKFPISPPHPLTLFGTTCNTWSLKRKYKKKQVETLIHLGSKNWKYLILKRLLFRHFCISFISGDLLGIEVFR